ncbi:putative membrane protein (DUF2078) [Desulfocapsa sulfexigens DSM 10523]|uniref:Putative membrane protein (DUF2078) n=1 Tax=Desulfocapsa sulfexigens (strain DSM 10523 / SB164P1) TaxID=1167006 RepID=M1PSG2_DESSD|nr:SHOCT domain-containing protein [Desulfocapsa sulfexigens]AGF79286.1 putative membrane protein (DUF2078) [Desulfocapsa sulfexigens DSM 10523]
MFGHNSVSTDWWCGMGTFFPGPLGMVVTFLFWGFVIYLIIFLFQALFSRGKRASSAHLDALKERYARGEINEDEYHRIKREIS